LQRRKAAFRSRRVVVAEVADAKALKDWLRDQAKRVTGKHNLLFELAEAALDRPDGVVREVVFPVVAEQTLRDLVKEWKATGPTNRTTLRTVIRNSYKGHSRRMVPQILRGNAPSNRPARGASVRSDACCAIDTALRYLGMSRARRNFGGVLTAAQFVTTCSYWVRGAASATCRTWPEARSPNDPTTGGTS
jgi:hypothetical protein